MSINDPILIIIIIFHIFILILLWLPLVPPSVSIIIVVVNVPVEWVVRVSVKVVPRLSGELMSRWWSRRGNGGRLLFGPCVSILSIEKLSFCDSDLRSRAESLHFGLALVDQTVRHALVQIIHDVVRSLLINFLLILRFGILIRIIGWDYWDLRRDFKWIFEAN